MDKDIYNIMKLQSPVTPIKGHFNAFTVLTVAKQLLNGILLRVIY